MGTSLGTLNTEDHRLDLQAGWDEVPAVAPAGGRRGFADPSSSRSETGHLRSPNRTMFDLDHLPSSVRLSKHANAPLASGVRPRPDGNARRRYPAGTPSRAWGSPLPSVGDDSGRAGGPMATPAVSLGAAGPGQGIPGRGQVSPVAVSTSAALATVSVTGSTSEIAVTATGSKAPGARVATETCGIHDVGR